MPTQPHQPSAHLTAPHLTPAKHPHMDILTQIQDELDMFIQQIQFSLHYIQHKTPPSTIPNQPLQEPIQRFNQPLPPPTPENPNPQHEPLPTQEEFQHELKTMSRDLVLKEQQIEVLIENLPGLKKTEQQQIEEMRRLERELEDVEGERMNAVREKERLVRRVEERIGRVGGMQ